MFRRAANAAWLSQLSLTSDDSIQIMQPLPRHAQPSEGGLLESGLPRHFQKVSESPEAPIAFTGTRGRETRHFFPAESYHYLPRIQHSREGKQVFKLLRGSNSWGRRGEKKENLSSRMRVGGNKKLETISVLRGLQSWWVCKPTMVTNGLNFSEGKVSSSTKGMSHCKKGKVIVFLSFFF